MKLLRTTPVLAALVLIVMAFSPAGSGIAIGDKAPLSDLKMKDVASDKMLSLKDLARENGLLVIFSCNTCPFVLAWEDQYPKLGELSAANKVGMVLVNSNEAKRKDEDSMTAMKEHYGKSSYNTPYVIDADSQLADAFGAKTTPHVYLFNKDMELVYRGSINDKFEDREKTASKFYLENAIRSLAAGRNIDPADTREIGCSIKRVKS